jgi:apolipoprotein N-acyltransferase
VIRATSTGVSAVIDGYGRPLQTLGIGAMGVLDAHLPGALAPTAYSRWGDTAFWILVVLGLLCGVPRLRTVKKM